MPFYGNKIGVLDAITRTYSSITVANLPAQTYNGGVLGLDNKLYFVPWIGRTRVPPVTGQMNVSKVTEIGIFDITTAQYSTIDISGMQRSWWDERHYSKAILAPDGTIYFFPYLCNYIFILYPKESNRIRTYFIPRLDPSFASRSGGVLAPNGKIYFLYYRDPFFRTNGFLSEYNLSTGLLTQILPDNMTTRYYGSHVLAKNGLIISNVWMNHIILLSGIPRLNDCE